MEKLNKIEPNKGDNIQAKQTKLDLAKIFLEEHAEPDADRKKLLAIGDQVVEMILNERKNTK